MTLVSIHAPEGRDSSACRGDASRSFDPRAREGRDVLLNEPRTVRATVSIHAPAKGATAMHCGLRARRFDPRAREGRDMAAYPIALS